MEEMAKRKNRPAGDHYLSRTQNKLCTRKLRWEKKEREKIVRYFLVGHYTVIRVLFYFANNVPQGEGTEKKNLYIQFTRRTNKYETRVPDAAETIVIIIRTSINKALCNCMYTIRTTDATIGEIWNETGRNFTLMFAINYNELIAITRKKNEKFFFSIRRSLVKIHSLEKILKYGLCFRSWSAIWKNFTLFTGAGRIDECRQDETLIYVYERYCVGT